MAEPVEITKKVREWFGDLPILKYVGTCDGKPVYKLSKLSQYDLEHSFSGGPSHLIVDVDDFEKSTLHPWTDWSFRITPDPDIEQDEQR